MINLIQNAENFQERTAISSNGKNYTYQQLLDRSKSIALQL
ncbi:MAG: acyl-CoA synthetase (AMP-forming)/AMP-acid ligase II, partial [Saprospiraceae bacterium]